MSTDSATNDTKGCVGCVVVIFILVAAGFYFGPDLLAWNKQRNRTNAVDDATTKALDRVPEFLAARRIKGELLARMRKAVDIMPWDAPESVKEPPPVGVFADRVLLWQERLGKPKPTWKPGAVPVTWRFDFGIDLIPTTEHRRKLPHEHDIRKRILEALPPEFTLDPVRFAVVHKDGDARPEHLTRVFIPKDTPELVHELLTKPGLSDPDAELPETRFVVARATTSSSHVGRYTDGVSASSGTITVAFFLVPSGVCVGVHKSSWHPPNTKYGRGGFNSRAKARSRFDSWLKTTHGYGLPVTKFLPECLPPQDDKKKAKPTTKRRR